MRLECAKMVTADKEVAPRVRHTPGPGPQERTVTVDTEKSSAFRRTDHPETLAGDPFAAAGRTSSRAAIIATGIATEPCERCGAVADLETDDGTPLCEGCAL
jgi:hypothetical protein